MAGSEFLARPRWRAKPGPDPLARLGLGAFLAAVEASHDLDAEAKAYFTGLCNKALLLLFIDVCVLVNWWD